MIRYLLPEFIRDYKVSAYIYQNIKDMIDVDKFAKEYEGFDYKLAAILDDEYSLLIKYDKKKKLFYFAKRNKKTNEYERITPINKMEFRDIFAENQRILTAIRYNIQDLKVFKDKEAFEEIVYIFGLDITVDRYEGEGVELGFNTETNEFSVKDESDRYLFFIDKKSFYKEMEKY